MSPAQPPPPSPLLTQVIAFLDQEGWAFERSPEGDAVRMRFRGQAGEWQVAAQEVGTSGGKLVIYSLPASIVPEPRRPAVAEAICRANYGLILGNWELDMRDGELRFKTSADLCGALPTLELIQSLVFTNVLMVDRYLAALLGVAFGMRDPAAAIAEAEAG